MLLCVVFSSSRLAANSTINQKDSISVQVSADLYNLTTKWANEFSSVNPGVKITVLMIPDAEASSWIVRPGLGFVSQEDFSSLINDNIWKEVVGRDVLVPVINSKNPFLREISEQGVSPEKLLRAFTQSEYLNWESLLKIPNNKKLNYYFINDESIETGVANFLNADHASFNGILVKNAKDMISVIQNDPGAMGFCRLSDILDSKNRQIIEKIKLLPIDRNGNGIIDYNEKIYEDLNTFTRGVWIGKYPKALYSNIYSVSATPPSGELEVAFMKWVLTDGQQFINPNGYSDLALNERQTKVNELVAGTTALVAQVKDYSKTKLILLILAGFLLLSFILDTALRYRKHAVEEVVLPSPVIQPVFNENTLTVLNGLYFDKSHTWAFMEKNGLVKIGIDDFLQHVTGTITQLKMKKPGEKVSKGEYLLSVINKGRQLNICAPVSGTIKEQNVLLNCNSSIINSSPYAEGWVYIIEPSNWIREIQFLFMAEKYQKWVKDEFVRLKDFLAAIVNPSHTQYAQVILQDGGEIIDNPLAELGPEVWEDFQTRFMDSSK
jgi:glycine cleavage system H lipoate-binding protein/ABC-type phosphate transport system substrate-binding protein